MDIKQVEKTEKFLPAMKSSFMAAEPIAELTQSLGRSNANNPERENFAVKFPLTTDGTKNGYEKSILRK